METVPYCIIAFIRLLALCYNDGNMIIITIIMLTLDNAPIALVLLYLDNLLLLFIVTLDLTFLLPI